MKKKQAKQNKRGPKGIKPRKSFFSVTPILKPKTREFQVMELCYDGIPLPNMEFGIDMVNGTITLHTGKTVKLIINEPVEMSISQYMRERDTNIPMNKAIKMIKKLREKNGLGV